MNMHYNQHETLSFDSNAENAHQSIDGNQDIDRRNKILHEDGSVPKARNIAECKQQLNNSKKGRVQRSRSNSRSKLGLQSVAFNQNRKAFGDISEKINIMNNVKNGQIDENEQEQKQ